MAELRVWPEPLIRPPGRPPVVAVPKQHRMHLIPHVQICR